ncbi:hypothetical protein HQQ81_17270 [Microbacteriaceae bacterium VKM Ac-2854]|nr:hypothetical protein [Microbacteriaceae bacterium VKM Ac-2854]
MRFSPRPIALGAMLLLLAGCAADAPGDSVPSSDALVGAEVDVWFRTDGTVQLCQREIDPGYSMDEPSCTDALAVTGMTSTELREQLRHTGLQSRSTDAAEIVPAFVIGRLSGRTLDLVSTDGERYVPESSATPTAEPTPVPSFATDEEKVAYSRAQPVPQPEGCTPPASGWGDMSGLGLMAADAYQSAHPDIVLGNVQRYIDHNDQIAILAVAAGADAQRVREDLADDYPNALCVVTSTLSVADLDRVKTDPVLNQDDTVLWSGLYVPRQSWDDPEPRFTAYVIVRTRKVVDAAAAHPAGLVSVESWFEPVVDRGA